MRVLVLLATLAAACGNSRMVRVVEEGPAGPDTFKVAVLHLSSTQGARADKAATEVDYDANFARAAALVREAAARGAKIIVTPEYINSGIRVGHGKKHLVATLIPDVPSPGPAWENDDARVRDIVRDYGRLAHETKTYVVTAMFERSDVGGKTRYYNASVVYAPDGRLVAHYRKIHRWATEVFVHTRGDRTVSFDTPYGRFGMLICFDAMFPGTWSKLTREHDVDFLVAPSLWDHAPVTGRMVMKLLANLSGRTVLWSNQQRGGLAGGAGVIRPWAADTRFGLWGPPGVIVANLPLPERLRDPVARLASR